MWQWFGLGGDRRLDFRGTLKKKERGMRPQGGARFLQEHWNQKLSQSRSDLMNRILQSDVNHHTDSNDRKERASQGNRHG